MVYRIGGKGLWNAIESNVWVLGVESLRESVHLFGY